MKKTFALIFAGVFAFMALSSCSDDKEDEIIPDDNGGGQQEEYDEAYYAANATISSSDSNFTATDDGGTIHFKTEGGSVAVDVDCGTEWTAQNSSVFECDLQSAGITVTAEQNTDEEELTGTIILMTAASGIQFATIEIVQAAYGAPEITVTTTEWNVPAKGALTTEIAVEANADWTAEAADSWLTVTKTDSGVSLTASENGETTERSTKVTLTCTDGIKTAYAYIEVNQTAAAYVSLSTESLSFESDASSGTVEVTSNYDWECSYDSDWFSVTSSGGTLTVTVEENEGEEREGIVTITAGDGAENVAEAQLTITQAEPEPVTSADMVFTYYIDSDDTTTNLPLSGTVDCTVDWGDGTVETITSTQPSHTYASAGDYDITISGTVTGLSTNNIATNSKALPIIAVKSWGETGLTNMQYAFRYCKNLLSLPDVTGDALVNITNASYAFYNCSSLLKIPDGLFSGCSSVTTFTYAFYQCTSISEIPDNLFAGCSKATNFTYTFTGCTNITTLPKGMFAGCSAITNFTQCFIDCYALTTIEEGLFDDCIEVTNFNYAFSECPITSIPASLFSNNLKVTNFGGTFSYCWYLTSESPYSTLSDGTKVHLYERETYASELGCVAPTTTKSCFLECESMADYKSVPSGWK